MFKRLELENFRAFGSRSRIEFAPITLIYGQNSAGKSSVLNALNLLKQTRMSRDHGALLLPRAERGLVDLGSFHEILHDHDAKKVLTIRVDLEAPHRRRASKEDDGLAELGFEVGFRRDDQGDVALAFLQAYSGSNGAEPCLRFEPKELAETDTREFRHLLPYGWRGNRRMSVRDIKAASCVAITESPAFWSPSYTAAKNTAGDIVRSLEALRDEVMGKSTAQTRQRGDAEGNVKHLESALEFYRSHFTLDQFISRRRTAELGATVGLDGFLPMPTRAEVPAEYPEAFAFRYARDPRARSLRIFDAVEFIVEAGYALENELERLFPLGPYRQAPERLYIFTGTTPLDVGYSGDLLPDLLFRKPGLVGQANKWLSRLDIGYELKIVPVGTPSNDLFEVRLLDTRRSSSTTIALPDVGFGISQILPFLVQTLASEEQTITIEQPEVHVHPRLQADLADVLIAGIQPEYNHRFIVETHSEHLILRLLRRIRETSEGTLPRGQASLTPEQVSVVYLERGREGALVHHLRTDASGEFIDRWPQGFFEERSKELF